MEEDEITPVVPKAAEKATETSKPLVNLDRKDSFLEKLPKALTGPSYSIPTKSAGTHQICRTCNGPKLNTQSWADHNTSANHLQALIKKDGFDTTVKLLDRSYNENVSIACDLCGTKFGSKILFKNHQYQDEHQKRAKQLADFVKAASESGYIDKWLHIAKPRKVTVREISTTLRRSLKK